jgi:type I restriction enzyme S subunit
MPLACLATLFSGGTPSKAEPAYWDGNIPWLTPKDMGHWNGSTEEKVSQKAIGNGTRLAPAGTIFIAVRGMSLHNEIRMIRSDAALTFNQDVKAIVPNKDVNGRFLYYSLLTKKSELLDAVEAAGHGTGRLPTDRLQSIAIPRLPPRVAGAISELFGALDDKIEVNRRMNETLEAMARALFKSWFVDFDPIRDEMGDEQQIPPRWTLCPLREIADVLSGGTPSKGVPTYWGGTIPWVSPKAMVSIHIDKTEARVTAAAIDNGTRLVPRGTVLVKVRGMGLHQGVRISQTQCDATFNQDVKALVPRRSDGVFLLFAMLDAAPRLLAKVQAAGHGTGVLTTEALESLLFAVPPPELANKLTEPLSVLNSKIVANDREKTLSTLRDALLPKLISGELRVREAETSIESVV